MGDLVKMPAGPVSTCQRRDKGRPTVLDNLGDEDGHLDGGQGVDDKRDPLPVGAKHAQLAQPNLAPPLCGMPPVAAGGGVVDVVVGIHVLGGVVVSQGDVLGGLRLRGGSTALAVVAGVVVQPVLVHTAAGIGAVVVGVCRVVEDAFERRGSRSGRLALGRAVRRSRARGRVARVVRRRERGMRRDVEVGAVVGGGRWSGIQAPAMLFVRGHGEACGREKEGDGEGWGKEGRPQPRQGNVFRCGIRDGTKGGGGDWLFGYAKRGRGSDDYLGCLGRGPRRGNYVRRGLVRWATDLVLSDGGAVPWVT